MPRRWNFASSSNSLYYWVQDQILTPSDLFVFSYSYVKVSQFLYSTPRISKNELELTNKIDGCLLVFSWNQLIFKQDYQLSIQTVTRKHMRLFLIYINPWQDFFFFFTKIWKYKSCIYYLFLNGMWNIFLLNKNCTMKFVHETVSSVTLKTYFSWYLGSDMSYWL